MASQRPGRLQRRTGLLDERTNRLDARERQLADLNQRVLAAVKGRSGHEFEQVGGTCRSDRKRPTRRNPKPPESLTHLLIESSQQKPNRLGGCEGLNELMNQ